MRVDPSEEPSKPQLQSVGRPYLIDLIRPHAEQEAGQFLREPVVDEPECEFLQYCDVGDGRGGLACRHTWISFFAFFG